MTMLNKFCEICYKEIPAKDTYCIKCAYDIGVFTTSFFRKNFRKGVQKRHSGKKYENSPERLEEIKNKYKNGVTIEHIKAMLE